MLTVCARVHVCACVHFASAWMVGQIFLSVCKSVSVGGRWPVNVNILTPKAEACQVGPKTQDMHFLEDGSDNVY
jgi:hypothetical protein